MFDVAWSEPVETVGQRKSRKDKQSNRLSQESSVTSNSNSSDASSRSQSQTRPSLFGLFSQKKGVLQRSGSSSKLSTKRGETTSKASKRLSIYTTTSDSPNQESSGAKTIQTSIPSKGCSDDGQQSSTDTEITNVSDDSVFSGWTGRSSAATDHSWASNFSRTKCEHVQPLSRNSYVTQSTEVTVSPRGSLNEDEQIATIVRISSVGTIPVKVVDSPSHSSPTTSTLEFPIPKLSLTDESTTVSPTGSVKQDLFLRPREAQPDSWRPPEAWQCPSVKVEPANLPPRLPRRSKDKKTARPSELTHLQKNIRKMDAASHKIILERLKEEWVGVADASVYRELELERQLWMLAALKALHADDTPDTTPPNDQDATHGAVASRKILSLYENKASSSFLSASNPTLEIHHLSTSPLLPKHYPNVRPLAVPGPSPQLPYASNIFAHIYTFSLPAILAASSIPAVLKECHRTLTSTSISTPSLSRSLTPPASSPLTPSIPCSKPGTLHLTILDPSPILSTLGPLLRAWLDTHLLINLERQFRCINPARLFPIWLSDAGLRAEGSTISNVRFLACVSHEVDGFSMIDGAGQEQGVVIEGVGGVSEECTRQELKSMVGRMLWKEMWGPFVQGEKWWWDDKRVVEECERVGTCWEYAVIEAVKEG